MSQPLVLAIEPDLRQAAIVKRIVREKALAEVAVVDSRDAAIAAMRTSMPDVLLLSALLSPRDEDELIAFLKTLENAGHLQTHTIPQLASALGPGEERASRGLLSAFRRKKEPAPIANGCDPDLFAEEIRVFLQRAAEKKRLLQNAGFTAPDMRPSAVETSRAAAAVTAEPETTPSSSWSSPFEWKPSGSSARTSAPASSTREAPQSRPTIPEPAIPEPIVTPPPASVIAEPSIGDQSPTAIPDPMIVAGPVAAAPAIPEAVVAIEPVDAIEPVVVRESVVLPEPIVVPESIVVPEPIVVPEAIVVPEPIVIPEPMVVAEPVAAAPREVAKTPAPGPAKAKPIAERAAKITERVQLQGKNATKTRAADGRDRLGPLARWARSDAPRAARSAPVTADDVRALISSLAVPPAVASVTYPRGCRIRRVRVPASPDHDRDQSSGPVILSRRTLAEQREKRSPA